MYSFGIWLLSCHVIISRIICVIWYISGFLLLWLSNVSEFHGSDLSEFVISCLDTWGYFQS